MADWCARRSSGMAGAADGLVMGTIKVGGRAADIVLYDYSVYAGTQSAMNHAKISRMFLHAEKHRLPVICWLDGGGARPHDMHVTARPSTETFVAFARLSGNVPTVGISPGRAFAGHANLAGLCDVLIATEEFGDGHGRSAAGRGRARQEIYAGRNRPVIGALGIRRDRCSREGRNRSDRCGEEISVLFRHAAGAGRGAGPDGAARHRAGKSAPGL